MSSGILGKVGNTGLDDFARSYADGKNDQDMDAVADEILNGVRMKEYQITVSGAEDKDDSTPPEDIVPEIRKARGEPVKSDEENER